MTTKPVLLAVTGIVILLMAFFVVMRHRQAERLSISQDSPQAAESIGNEMARLHVHAALVVQSMLIKGFPVWSPDSRFLGVMLQGYWFKLDTNQLQLKGDTWYGQRIGVISPETKTEVMTTMTVQQAADWATVDQHGDREVKVKSGMKAKILYQDASSTLLISQGARSSVIWKANLENCGALTLSPSGSYLAYTCDISGLFVMDIGQVTQDLASDGKRRNSQRVIRPK